jgi:hypothetical protein
MKSFLRRACSQKASSAESNICGKVSGPYYKHIAIIIDTASIVSVILQIVASLTIIIDDTSYS